MRSPLLGTKEWLRALDLDEVTAVRTSHVRHEAIGLRERYYRDVCSVMGLRQLVREVKATRETGLDFCDCMPSAVIEIAFQSDDRLFIFPTSGGDTLGLIHFRGKAEVGRVTMEIAGSRALLDRIVDPGRGLIQ